MQLGRTEKPVLTQPEVPLLKPGHTYGSITDKIGDTVLSRKTPLGWMVGFGLGAVLFTLFLMAVGYLFYVGVGAWGINIPVAWGFAIITFVWWIGIGHAGTLMQRGGHSTAVVQAGQTQPGFIVHHLDHR